MPKCAFASLRACPLLQVLLNIGQNAIRFTTSGFVDISATEAPAAMSHDAGADLADMSGDAHDKFTLIDVRDGEDLAKSQRTESNAREDPGVQTIPNQPVRQIVTPISSTTRCVKTVWCALASVAFVCAREIMRAFARSWPHM
eukprot:6214011-Pleurochrysis_carterae.AAC.1